MSKSWGWSLVIVFLAATARGQSIFTIAGGGPIGDGRLATEALLLNPQDTSVDAAGNIYIADSGNHRIRRLDAKSGVITTVAGGGTSGLGDGKLATQAELLNPIAVVIDKSGNLFISSRFLIRRVDAKNGIITTYAGGGNVTTDGVPATEAAMSPAGLAVDAAGNLFIADTAFGNDRVRRVDVVTRIISTVAGTTKGFGGDGGPATQAMLSSPLDVAFDTAGNLYITDSNNNRVRKVDASTGVITTVAGNGQGAGPNGDGRPSTQAAVWVPNSLVVDSTGNIYVDTCCTSVRRIDARSGIITTYAGGGLVGFGGDGGQAGRALFAFPRGLALDAEGNLLICDQDNHRVRRVNAASGIINTIAGGGSAGDGGPALAAQLIGPRGIALDPEGDIYIGNSGGYRVRKVSMKSGLITTVAGTGQSSQVHTGDGGPATSAALAGVDRVAVDASKNVFISGVGKVRKVDAATGIITTVAGKDSAGFPLFGFAGDGGPATDALLSNVPSGMALDPAGNLYVADSGNHRIRKIDRTTGIITTIAGSGPTYQPGQPAPGGFGGDGGPATAALLDTPIGMAFDTAGNLYFADPGNNRIRKIAASTGIITTVAGKGGIGGSSGDFGPALLAGLNSPVDVAFDAVGNLYISEGNQIRRVIAATGIIEPFAGFGASGFSGDGGPASLARLFFPSGIAIDRASNLFVADTGNSRIRAVYACVTLQPPALTAPVDGATGIGTAPTLTWNSVNGAFRYDVYLSTLFPPNTLVASDITATSFTPSNLLAGTKYYWSVVAKGDRFCPNFSTATSAIRSFTTSTTCEPPAPFELVSPTDAATGVSGTVQLTWQSSLGAAGYDILLGTTNPPPLLASTTTTSFNASGLAAGTTYYWGIVAHAACDAAKTRASAVRSFKTAGGCPPPGAFAQVTPPAGATNVPTTATLEWSPSPNATSYDFYLGTTNPPPIYLLDLAATKLTISGLTAGATYNWRVVAKVACDPTRTTSTPVSSFTVRTGCSPPKPTSFSFVPPSSVAIGQTYVVAWNEAQDLEPGGFYLIERSTSESFATIVDAQETTANSASFIASAAGTYVHRIRPVNPCSTGSGAPALSRAVTVVPAPPNVIFTVQPEAVLTTLGQNLEDKRARFVIENIGTEAISVIIGRQEIDSVPFFSIVDPLGGDSTFIALEPRKPKALEIHFSGPPNDKPASYQGVIFLASIGKGLAITPYAFVNLRVGGGEAAAPQFRSGGARTEYAFFPGFNGDDALRPPITVEITNPGSTPMELGAEIGPEVWLVPESGWNATAIPPGGTRPVKLFTRRNRAPHGSALPRYTYFTARTKTGLSARLLVQDNEVSPTANGRGSALDPSIRALIAPEVISTDAKTFSTLRLSNVGSEAVQADLFFTPAEADGFDLARVKRATIAIPPNDVVTLTDPLVQLWGLGRPAKGEIEIRAPQEKIGLVAARANTTHLADDGGSFGYTVPIVGRSEGARSSSSHTISGITADDQTRGALTLAETSGADHATVRVELFDSNGDKRSERTVDLARYSMTEIDEVTGGTIIGGRLSLTVTASGGSVVGMAKLLDRTSGGGTTLVSRPAASTTQSAALAYGVRWPRHRFQSGGTAAALPRTFFVPVVVNGPLVSSSSQTYQTVLGLSAPSAATKFILTYRDGGATPKTAAVNVPRGGTVEYRNLVAQLFGGGPSEGSLAIESDAAADVYARLTSTSSGVTRVSVSQALPVITPDSEQVTTGDSQRPLYLDGLEQSVDPTRGTRWMLLLNELGGKASTIILRLYEAGNRSAPIAEKELSLPALVHLKLDSVFATMDLDSDQRRKDRANVLLSVVLKSGGIAAATALAIDNKTGESKSFALAPASASTPAVERVTAVTPVTPSPGRRRAARP